jgi:hypothetical protein
VARYELDQRQRLLVDQHGSAAELSPATVMQSANARSLTVAKGTEPVLATNTVLTEHCRIVLTESCRTVCK